MAADPKELLKQFEPKEINVIAAEPQVSLARFSPCGKILVAGSYDRRVRRWNIAAGDAAAAEAVANAPPESEKPTKGKPAPVTPVPEMSAIEGHNGWVEALAFRADGELLFSADTWGQIRCSQYTAENAEPKWKNETAHDGWIRDLAVSADGKRLASCGADKRVRIWSADDGKMLEERAAYGEDIFCVRFHPDGSLVTGDFKGIVKHWKPDGSLVRQFDCSALFTLSRLQDCGGVRALAFDKEHKTLAVGGTQPKNGGTVVGVPTLFLFDFASGEQKQKLELGTTNDVSVHDIHFHDGGFWSIITCGTPGAGQLLYLHADDKTPFFTKKLSNPHSLSWHPDGKRLAVAATNTGSNGNGRPLDKDGKYKGNHSPIHVFSLPVAT